jgi:hypothetical protein
MESVTTILAVVPSIIFLGLSLAYEIFSGHFFGLLISHHHQSAQCPRIHYTTSHTSFMNYLLRRGFLGVRPTFRRGIEDFYDNITKPGETPVAGLFIIC